MYRNARGGGNNLGMILLLLHIGRIGVDKIPPVTLGFLILNTVFHYMNPLHLSLGQVCIGASYVIQHAEVQRLLLACFYHVNDTHLYYNMTSFIWKGRQLEPLFGAKKFAWLILVLGIVSNCLLVATEYSLNQGYSCAVGFSAVLFGLKVVLQHCTPEGPSNVMGLFTVSSKYIYWVELLMIQLMVPNASFLGHLCGIAAGLMYINGFLDILFYPLDLIPDFTIPEVGGRQGDQWQEAPQYPPRPQYPPGGNRRVVRGGVLY